VVEKAAVTAAATLPPVRIPVVAATPPLARAARRKTLILRMIYPFKS